MSVILVADKWSVCDLTLSPEKMLLLWRIIKRHRTLFSDLTRNDSENFVKAITSEDTMWFEVKQDEVTVGIVWFEGMHLVTEMTGHMAFFDRRPAEKLIVFKTLVKWAFDNFPIHRMNVTPPDIYTATRRLLRRIGFKEEGVKREAVLIDGIYRDQILFGITRSEVEAL